MTQMAGFLSVPNWKDIRRKSASVAELHEMASADDLREALQCPICQDVPMPPVYTCSSGHTICKKCEDKKTECTVCGEHMSKFARNKAIEAIVARSSFWCKYMKDGCSKIVQGSDYLAHTEQCHFRRIKCYDLEVNYCNGEAIPFKEYFNHLKAVHQVEGAVMRSKALTMSEYSNCFTDGPWPSFYMQYEGHVFLRNMKIEKSTLYLWFTIIATDQEALNYRMKVSIYMKHSQDSRCDWTVPVYSVRTTPEQLEESAFRAAIPCHQLELYCSEKRHPHGEIFKFVLDLRYELIVLDGTC